MTHSTLTLFLASNDASSESLMEHHVLLYAFTPEKVDSPPGWNMQDSVARWCCWMDGWHDLNSNFRCQYWTRLIASLTTRMLAMTLGNSSLSVSSSLSTFHLAFLVLVQAKLVQGRVRLESREHAYVGTGQVTNYTEVVQIVKCLTYRLTWPVLSVFVTRLYFNISRNESNCGFQSSPSTNCVRSLIAFSAFFSWFCGTLNSLAWHWSFTAQCLMERAPLSLNDQSGLESLNRGFFLFFIYYFFFSFSLSLTEG